MPSLTARYASLLEMGFDKHGPLQGRRVLLCAVACGCSVRQKCASTCTGTGRQGPGTEANRNRQAVTYASGSKIFRSAGPTAVGVARPRAQGHATTSTSTASRTASGSAPPSAMSTTSGNTCGPAAAGQGAC